MSVDKFGRNGDRTTTVYTEINIANLINSFEEIELTPQLELLI